MKLAIFDFDGTLFPKDTLPYLLSQWHRLKYSKTKLLKVYLPLIPLYIKYKTGMNSELTREEMRIMAVKGFNGLFTNMTEQDINNYFTNACQSIKILLNNAVVNEVHKARHAGFHTVILSGAYSLFLKNIGEYLEVDTIIGTEIYFKDGQFDDHKEIDLVSGSSKVEKLQNYFKDHSIDWSESYAYADSYSDLQLLELIGNPVVVNPDHDLQLIASKRKWRTISS